MKPCFLRREYLGNECPQIKQEENPICQRCDKHEQRNVKARESKKARDEAYSSCGLVKVRVNGHTYWE